MKEKENTFISMAVTGSFSKKILLRISNWCPTCSNYRVFVGAIHLYVMNCFWIVFIAFNNYIYVNKQILQFLFNWNAKDKIVHQLHTTFFYQRCNSWYHPLKKPRTYSSNCFLSLIIQALYICYYKKKSWFCNI